MALLSLGRRQKVVRFILLLNVGLCLTTGENGLY